MKRGSNWFISVVLIFNKGSVMTYTYITMYRRAVTVVRLKINVKNSLKRKRTDTDYHWTLCSYDILLQERL